MACTSIHSELLRDSSSLLCALVSEYTVDDRCVILLLKGLCLKNQGETEAAEDCFNTVYKR